MISGFGLAVSGLSRLRSESQDELSRIAMTTRQHCIDHLNKFNVEVKKVVERDVREITELLHESRLLVFYSHTFIDIDFGLTCTRWGNYLNFE